MSKDIDSFISEGENFGYLKKMIAHAIESGTYKPTEKKVKAQPQPDAKPEMSGETGMSGNVAMVDVSMVFKHIMELEHMNAMLAVENNFLKQQIMEMNKKTEK